MDDIRLGSGPFEEIAAMHESDLDRNDTVRWLGKILHNDQGMDLELALSLIHRLGRYAQTDSQNRGRLELRQAILGAMEGDGQALTLAWRNLDDAWSCEAPGASLS